MVKYAFPIDNVLFIPTFIPPPTSSWFFWSFGRLICRWLSAGQSSSRSVGQLFGGLFGRSLGRSAGQLVRWWVGGLLDQWVGGSDSRLTGPSVGQSVGRLVNRLVNWCSVSRLIGWSVGQSFSRSIGRLVNHLEGCLFFVETIVYLVKEYFIL